MNILKKKSYVCGFTLIEMIVSMGIFTVVAVIAVGALLHIVNTNNQAQTLQTAMNNAGFALDAMSREIRVGSSYRCDQNINADDYNPKNIFDYGSGSNFSKSCNMSDNMGGSIGNVMLGFQSSQYDPTNTCRLIFAYLFIQDPSYPGEWIPEKAEQNHCDDTFGSSGGANVVPFVPILDESNLHVTDFRVGDYSAAYSGTPGYNWIFLRLTGYSGVKAKNRSTFDVQTSISQRIHD